MRQLIDPRYFGRPSIGLALFGCRNRPFYQICVFPDKALGRPYEGNIIEQIGSFDPLANVRNEKLVAINYGRLKYWIAKREAHISVPVLELLGLCGLFPIHPKTFIRARENRAAAENVVRSFQEKTEKNDEIQENSGSDKASEDAEKAGAEKNEQISINEEEEQSDQKEMERKVVSVSAGGRDITEIQSKRSGN